MANAVGAVILETTMNESTINLNHNAAECIKSAAKFGETVYTNICNGIVSTVAWGGVDWLGFIGLIGLCLIFGLIFIATLLMMLTEF